MFCAPRWLTFHALVTTPDVLNAFKKFREITDDETDKLFDEIIRLNISMEKLNETAF